MHCDEVREKSEEYLDGLLSKKERLEIDKHLQACPDCLKTMNELCQMHDLLDSLEEEELPREFQQRLHDCLAQTAQAEQNTQSDKKEQILQNMPTDQNKQNIEVNKKNKKSRPKHKIRFKQLAGLTAVLAVILLVYIINPFGNTGSGPYDSYSQGQAAQDDSKEIAGEDFTYNGSEIQNGNAALTGPEDQISDPTLEGDLHTAPGNAGQSGGAGIGSNAASGTANAAPGEDELWNSYGEGFGGDEPEGENSAVIRLYISDDWDIENKTDEVINIAESLHMVLLDRNSGIVVFQVSDVSEGQAAALLSRLSAMGRVEHENITKNANILTVYVEA